MLVSVLLCLSFAASYEEKIETLGKEIDELTESIEVLKTLIIEHVYSSRQQIRNQRKYNYQRKLYHEEHYPIYQNDFPITIEPEFGDEYLPISGQPISRGPIQNTTRRNEPQKSDPRPIFRPFETNESRAQRIRKNTNKESQKPRKYFKIIPISQEHDVHNKTTIHVPPSQNYTRKTQQNTFASNQKSISNTKTIGKRQPEEEKTAYTFVK